MGAYTVFSSHHARFVTAVAADMLDDLRADVAADPNRRVVFLGRDGHSYAAAVRGLDPEFFTRHCSEIVVSRAVVEAALQDLERHTGAEFTAVEAFRVRARVEPEQVDRAFQALTDYLGDAGVGVHETGSAVTVVDNSFKGTIQELLTAAYPDTTFTGRYALHSAHPEDPHPGTKVGYAFHQPAGPRWQGTPEPSLPADPELTLGAGDAVAAIERTLHGPNTSPRAIGPDGPIQQAQRTIADPLRGLNPALVHPSYQDPAVREASKAAALLAVSDTAAAAAARWTSLDPGAIEQEREDTRAAFSGQLRAWIEHGPDLDPRLGELLDSFVLRSDHVVLAELQDSFTAAGLDVDDAAPVWAELAATTDLTEKRDVALRALDA
ncbi:MAG: hypothetical protein L0I76_36480, partial [Pseudonocardia sp.]|nr:hypothetical protein [Pseudonocardia sp.]